MANVILFSECGINQRREFAKDVMVGKKEICVLIDRDCFGISVHDSGYSASRDGGIYSSDTVMPFFKKFEVQKFLNYKWTEDEALKLVALGGRRSAFAYYDDDASDELIGIGPAGGDQKPLMDRNLLQQWIHENGRQIKPGIYSLHYSREIAAEIVASNEDCAYLPDLTDGVVSYWSPINGILVKEGDDLWEIYEVLPVIPMEHDDLELTTYAEVARPCRTSLAFLEVVNVSKKLRTRTDPIKSLMMRYLDQKDGKGDFRGCIESLLADPEIDEAENGKILYTSYNGKPQSVTRKTLQNRFSDYRKKWEQ
jgi:hypothetical protein